MDLVEEPFSPPSTDQWNMFSSHGEKLCEMKMDTKLLSCMGLEFPAENLLSTIFQSGNNMMLLWVLFVPEAFCPALYHMFNVGLRKWGAE